MTPLSRKALKVALGGLEDWLYSEEADDADLAAVKTKRKEARFRVFFFSCW